MDGKQALGIIALVVGAIFIVDALAATQDQSFLYKSVFGGDAQMFQNSAQVYMLAIGGIGVALVALGLYLLGKL